MQCLKIIVTLVLGRPCQATAPQGLGVFICKMGTKVACSLPFSLFPFLPPSQARVLGSQLTSWGQVWSGPLGLSSLCSPAGACRADSIARSWGQAAGAPCPETAGCVSQRARIPLAPACQDSLGHPHGDIAPPTSQGGSATLRRVHKSLCSPRLPAAIPAAPPPPSHLPRVWEPGCSHGPVPALSAP